MFAAMPLWMINDVPIRILAVLGAFGLGYVLLGVIVAVLVKLTTGQKTPAWLLYIFRTLGGIVTCWLAILWLFGVGGYGLGGPGGYGLGGAGSGSGDGTGTGTELVSTSKDSPPAEKEKAGKSDEPGIGEGDTIRVEILGPEPLRKLAGTGKVDPTRLYRLAGQKGNLLTLQELQALLRKRRDGKPPLRRLEIVLYLDSPAREVSHVAALARWARDLGDERDRFRVDFTDQDGYAPVD